MHGKQKERNGHKERSVEVWVGFFLWGWEHVKEGVEGRGAPNVLLTRDTLSGDWDI